MTSMEWLSRIILMASARFEISLALKATIVVATCFAALGITPRAKASARHLMIIAGFLTLLALPLAAKLLPSVDVTLSAASTTISPATADGSATNGMSIGITIASLWVAGILGLLISLIVDVLRLYHIRRTASGWLEKTALVRALAEHSGINRRIDVMLHDSVSGPLTFGFWRPAILFPREAREWSSEELRRALIHELEHVRRADWLSQLISRLICIGYWPHPLVWMAWRRLSLEAERACDDAVVAFARNTEYAEQLLNSARRINTRYALPGVAMARRSDLSARIASILDESRHRGRPSTITAWGVVCVATGMVLSIAPLNAIRSVALASVEVRPSPGHSIATVRPIQTATARKAVSVSSPRRHVPVNVFTPQRTFAGDALQHNNASSRVQIAETRSSSASSSSSSSSDSFASWSTSTEASAASDSIKKDDR